jgi:hypothetical protein
LADLYFDCKSSYFIRGAMFEPNMGTPYPSPIYGGFPPHALQDHTSWLRLPFANFETREWAATSASILRARKRETTKSRSSVRKPTIRAERRARRAADSVLALEAHLEATSEMLSVVERTAALPEE